MSSSFISITPLAAGLRENRKGEGGAMMKTTAKTALAIAALTIGPQGGESGF